MKKITLWGHPVPLLGFLHWLSFLLIYFAALIICVIVTPFLPAFATKDGKLPKWLKWFDTPDNSLDGDSGWKEKHSLWVKVLPEWTQTYVARVFWLYRNPLYGFSISVLGAPKDKFRQPILEGKGFDVKGTYKSHYWMVYFMRDDHVKKRRFKVYIGWKLKAEGFEKYQFAFLINPFQTP